LVSGKNGEGSGFFSEGGGSGKERGKLDLRGEGLRLGEKTMKERTEGLRGLLEVKRLIGKAGGRITWRVGKDGMQRGRKGVGNTLRGYKAPQRQKKKNLKDIESD